MIANQNVPSKILETTTKDTPSQEDKKSDNVESQSEEGASCKTEFIKVTVVQENTSNQDVLEKKSKLTSDNKTKDADNVRDTKSKPQVKTKSQKIQQFSPDSAEEGI